MGTLPKERFPTKRKTKLDQRGDGPFRVVERINDNAYKIELPGEYGVSATFNVADLSPFDVGEDSRTNPFQEGEDDVIHQGEELEDSYEQMHEDDHVGKHAQTHANSHANTRTKGVTNQAQSNGYKGPITRSMAKDIHKQMQAYISHIKELEMAVTNTPPLEDFNVIFKNDAAIISPSLHVFGSYFGSFYCNKGLNLML